MRPAPRMGTAAHKSCHPGRLLLGRERRAVIIIVLLVGGGGVTVNSYVSRPITAGGADKSILTGVMKGTLMHVHNGVAPHQ